jgi:hypothetical protein
MAGRGRMPKPDEKLVGRHPKIAMRVVGGAEVALQPPLPKRRWSPETLKWWAMWGESPLSAEFTANDWTELKIAAVFHDVIWDPTATFGEKKNAGAELRQRTAKFGSTPEDRVRLRIQFAYVEQAEEKADEARARKKARAEAGARARRGPHVAAS